MSSEIIKRELGFIEYLTMSAYFYVAFAVPLLPIAYLIYLPLDVMNFINAPIVIVIAMLYGLFAYTLSSIGITFTCKLLLQQQYNSKEQIIKFISANALDAIKTDFILNWKIIFQPLVLLFCGGFFLNNISETLSGLWFAIGICVVFFRLPHLSVLYAFNLQNGVHHGIWGMAALERSRDRIESGSKLYWQIFGIKVILFFAYVCNFVLSNNIGESMIAIIFVSILGTAIIAYEQTLMAIFYLNNNRSDFTQDNDSEDSVRVTAIFASLDSISTDYSSIRSLKSMNQRFVSPSQSKSQGLTKKE